MQLPQGHTADTSQSQAPKLIARPYHRSSEVIFLPRSEPLQGCGHWAWVNNVPWAPTYCTEWTLFPSCLPHPLQPPEDLLASPDGRGLQRLVQLPALAWLPASPSPAPVLAISTRESSVPVPRQQHPPQSAPLITLNGKDHKSFINFITDPISS